MEKWKNSQQLKRIKRELVISYNVPTNEGGKLFLVEKKLMKKLFDVIDQAIHTEEGHEA